MWRALAGTSEADGVLSSCNWPCIWPTGSDAPWERDCVGVRLRAISPPRWPESPARRASSISISSSNCLSFSSPYSWFEYWLWYTIDLHHPMNRSRRHNILRLRTVLCVEISHMSHFPLSLLTRDQTFRQDSRVYLISHLYQWPPKKMNDPPLFPAVDP